MSLFLGMELSRESKKQGRPDGAPRIEDWWMFRYSGITSWVATANSEYSILPAAARMPAFSWARL